LLETSSEDLLAVVHETLRRKPEGPVGQDPRQASRYTLPQLYLLHDQRDTDLVTAWADALFEQQLEVIRPLFDGDEADLREYHEENLTACDGVIIFYGAGNELWLRRKLKEVQKSAAYRRTKPTPPVAVCLLAPRSAEKERFKTHEAVVVPQWEGVSLDLLKPFISRLKPNV
jgi:hypothetical protein